MQGDATGCSTLYLLLSAAHKQTTDIIEAEEKNGPGSDNETLQRTYVCKSDVVVLKRTNFVKRYMH